MTGAVRLLLHSLKRSRTLVLTTGLLLAAFQVVLILVARSMHRSGAFAQLANMLPPFVRALFGPSLVSFMSFSGIVCVAYIEVAVIGALVAISIALATIPVSEIETGFIDLILSRPLARHWIVTRTIVVLALSVSVLVSMMMAGAWIGLETLAPKDAPWPSAKLIESLGLNLDLLAISWGGVAMALGSVSRRRRVPGGIAGLLALTAYLLDYTGRMWKPAESIAWLSPFRYYTPFDLVMGGPLPVKNLMVLAGIAATGFAAAYVLFSRRDISR
jgi:beta-exotoxin I transport system permease protein